MTIVSMKDISTYIDAAKRLGFKDDEVLGQLTLLDESPSEPVRKKVPPSVWWETIPDGSDNITIGDMLLRCEVPSGLQARGYGNIIAGLPGAQRLRCAVVRDGTHYSRFGKNLPPDHPALRKRLTHVDA